MGVTFYFTAALAARDIMVRMKNRLRRAIVGWAAGLAVLLSGAPTMALDLELTSGDWRPINILVENFAGDERGLAGIIRADLRASGYFLNLDYTGKTGNYGAVSEKYLEYVRGRGGEYLLTGKVVVLNDSDAQLYFKVHDTLTERELGSFSLDFDHRDWRRAAHQISNWIYESVVRQPGVFHTKVAYVVREKDGTNKLRVADYDGHNLHTVLTSPEAIISIAWTPDGNQILYVSFERNKPVVYRQSLLTGERRVVANFAGSNSGPAISPDGQKVAVVLTKNKHLQQIYIMSAAQKRRMRVGRSIDTEPAWSPNGRRIVFVSDDSGTPQIYEYKLENSAVRRLSFGSNYCVSPSYSADGKRVLHIRRNAAGRNNVALLDIQSGGEVFLTNIREADSPSFSPNDAMVLYKNENLPNFLYIVAVNGIIKTKWKNHESGRIINPVWGPSKSGWY